MRNVERGRNIVRDGWEDVDWVDMEPGPGSFLNPKPMEAFEIHGETIMAFNWVHAQYLFVHRHVDANGEEWQTCCHCGAHIRYAVVFRDLDGHYHIVGEQCGQFINAGQKRKDYSKEYHERKTLAAIKEIDTKNGLRYIVTMEVPSWYWEIPKSERPEFVSVNKISSGPAAGRWWMTIWGECRGQTFEHWHALKLMRVKSQV